MATTLKAQMSKFMIALAMAVVASLFCAGSAFADVTVNVTFPTSATTTNTQQVRLDQAGVWNDLVADGDSDEATIPEPVVGMFNKRDNADRLNKWNTLVTGTAAHQYASWDKILAKAVAQYDPTGTLTVDQVNGYATNKTLSLTATDGDYDKYYPDAADLKGDSTGSAYFYDLATNANTTLLSTLRSNIYALTSTVNGKNPNGVGPVFAWEYGSAVAATTVITSDDEEDESVTYEYETAGSAAQRAASNISTYAHPRLIMGCQDDWTTSTAMGKRYCTNITGITLS